MSKLEKEILNLLCGSTKHMNAEEIFLLAKDKKIKISLASTYRVLSSLVEKDLIKKIKIKGQVDVYDKTTIPHDHMICDKCGRISDITIKDFKKKLEKETGVSINDYDLTIHYICDKCKKKNNLFTNIGGKHE